MLTSEELEWFRDRAKRSEPTNLNNQALGRIVAEVDRLREGARLAREWLRLDAGFRGGLDLEARIEARESFRAWTELGKL